MAEFKMPSMGADMDKGKIISWLVSEGQEIKRGEIVAEVETQKGIIEIESWQNGLIEKLVAKPGDTLAVGETLAIIGDKDTLPENKESFEPTPAFTKQPEPKLPLKVEGHQRIKISPVARKVLEGAGIDPSQLKGLDLEVIHKADVEKWLEEHANLDEILSEEEGVLEISQPLQSELTVSHDRSFISQLMSRSNTDIPHFYLQQVISIESLSRYIENLNTNCSTKDRLLLVAFFVKALANACKLVPAVNGFWRNNTFEKASQIHVGIAIHSSNFGLKAPAIHNADKKSVKFISQELVELTARVRSGHVRLSEFKDPTITLTALGEQGVDAVYGMIYPPQVALLGIGASTNRVLTDGKNISIQSSITATLAGDHRAIDGHEGSRFLHAFARCLYEEKNFQTEFDL